MTKAGESAAPPAGPAAASRARHHRGLLGAARALPGHPAFRLRGVQDSHRLHGAHAPRPAPRPQVPELRPGVPGGCEPRHRQHGRRLSELRIRIPAGESPQTVSAYLPRGWPSCSAADNRVIVDKFMWDYSGGRTREAFYRSGLPRAFSPPKRWDVIVFRVPMDVRCRDCGVFSRRPHRRRRQCPMCGSTDVQIVKEARRTTSSGSSACPAKRSESAMATST